MEYLKNKEIQLLIANAPSYQKSSLTGLRIPELHEFGKEFNTYVIKDGELRVESHNIISKNVIVARNPGVIGQFDGKDIYNEWLISKEVALKNYGEQVISHLSQQFTEHKKQATIQAIELTPEIMDKLGVQGHILYITVSWSTDPMIAHVGDYLTNAGYSISSYDMKNTYEIVSNTK